MSPVRLLVSFFGLIFFITGCQKTPSSDRIFTFTNSLSMPVTVTVYSSQYDYNNNVNVFMKFLIWGHSDKTIVGQIEDGKTYYVECSNGNLLRRVGGNQTYFTKKDERFLITYDHFDSTTVLLLNGNGTESHWKRINTLHNLVSTWDTLPETEKYREIVFRKDKTVALYYKDAGGHVNVMLGSYHNSGGNFMNLYVDNITQGYFSSKPETYYNPDLAGPVCDTLIVGHDQIDQDIQVFVKEK